MKVKEAVAIRFEQICSERTTASNELANISGIMPSTVYSMLDKSRKDITITIIKKLCDGLGITLAEFFDDNLFNRLDQELE